MTKAGQINPWLNELLEAGLEPAEVLDIIQSFLDTTPAILVELEHQLDGGNTRESARIAHRLIGGAANMGLGELERMARDTERLCEEGELRRAIDLLGLVADAFEAAKQELETACALLRNA